MSLSNQTFDCQSTFTIESAFSKCSIVNLICYTSPNLEIVTDWYIQLAFLYIALWKHDFKYLPTYSIALCKKNKKGWIFAHNCISKCWMKGYEENSHSEKMTFHNLSDIQKGNEALSSSLN